MKKIFSKGKWNQYFAGSVAGLSYGYCGMSYVWVNPIILKILTPSSDLRMTASQTDLAASLPELTSLASPLFVSYAADRWGRRTALLVTAPIQILTWIGLVFITHPGFVLFIRGVQGIIMGAVQTVLPMYLAEIGDSKSRGKLSLLYTLGWNIGLLAEYSFSPFLKYDVVNYINIIPPTIFFFAFLFFAESPYYLVLVGDLAGAKKSLEFFRDDGVTHEEELLEIEMIITDEKKEESTWSTLITNRLERKSLIVILVISLTFNMCGAMSVLVYCNKTFNLIFGKKVFSDVLTVVLGAGLTLVTVLTMLLVDLIGRRPLLIASYLGSMICLIPAAAFFFMEEVEHLRILWLVDASLIGLVLFPSFITVGAMTIVHTYQGELFCTATRGTASALVTLVGNLTSVAALASFPLAQAENKDYLTFFVYTIAAFVGLVFSILVAPETKGLTLEEIQRIEGNNNIP